MKTSFVHRYRLAVNNYEHFIKEHRPERLGEDQPPLLPLTLDDLLQYYDHKFQLCNYRTTRNYVSSLLHHPEHGAEWKRDIFESYLAEEKRNQMREAERNGESNIQNSGVLRPLQRSSRFFTYVPAAVVPEKGQIYDNNSECHVIQGVNRGYVISITNQLLPTPSLSPPSQQEYQPIEKRKNTPNYCLVEEPLRKLNVSQLASQVHITSYVAPISHRSRMLRQTD